MYYHYYYYCSYHHYYSIYVYIYIATCIGWNGVSCILLQSHIAMGQNGGTAVPVPSHET